MCHPYNYISVVGIDGAGHGISIECLKRLFPRAFYTSEPNGVMRAFLKPEETSSVESITTATLEERRKQKISPETYFHTMLASRWINYQNSIWPALKNGNLVISDRSHLCTFAYQLIAQGLITRPGYLDVWLDGAERFISKGLHLLLDCDPSIAMSRKSSQAVDEIDKSDLLFFQKVRAGYLKLAEGDYPSGKIVTIDASKSIADVQSQIYKTLKKEGF